jgi:hypothetical protein
LQLLPQSKFYPSFISCVCVAGFGGVVLGTLLNFLEDHVQCDEINPPLPGKPGVFILGGQHPGKIMIGQYHDGMQKKEYFQINCMGVYSLTQILQEASFMKRAVSISIGSSKRDKAVTVKLLGEEVSIERIGTDGDMEVAARKYQELDGKVDAFGVGGADLGLMVDDKWYRLYSVEKMVRFIKQTPVVDGTGLKNSLENKAAPFVEAKLGDYIRKNGGKKAFVMTGADRWGLAHGFIQAGYECTFGDLMFSLGIPIAIHTEKQLKTLASILMPVAGRLPFEWVYPTGEKQEERKPKYPKWFARGVVIAGDCHYIKHASGCGIVP